MQEIIKTKSLFKFKDILISPSGYEVEIIINLEIDYISETYSITPCGVVGKDSFKFTNCNEYYKWKIIMALMFKANDFAYKELNIK